jgi:hypothetical protein
MLAALLSPAGGAGGQSTDDANPFGVAASRSIKRPEVYKEWLPVFAQANVKWVRAFALWGEVEPERGRYDFTLPDTRLSIAGQNGFKAVGAFSMPPKWLAEKDRTGNLPSGEGLKHWSDYVTAVTQRYKDRVSWWEVWNEPNISFGGPGGGKPDAYAAAVVEACNAAKKVDANAKIGLSVASVDLAWLKKAILANNGALKGHYDFICIHPYEVASMIRFGWEGVYMHMVKTIRTMLKDVDPGRANVPVWITEVGTIGDGAHEPFQAELAFKTYIMALAQGIARIMWFDAQDGDSGPMGMLDRKGAKRRSYFALKSIIAGLGPAPEYQGFVHLESRAFGFVFRREGSSFVMAVWAPPGKDCAFRFGKAVKVVAPFDEKVQALAAGEALSIRGEPVLVLDLPSGLIDQARLGRDKPFPWDGDFTGAKSIRLTMGEGIKEEGLHLKDPERFAAGDVDGEKARYSTASRQRLQVDPNFLAYTAVPLKIEVVARRKDPAREVKLDLSYESPAGYSDCNTPVTLGDGGWQTAIFTVRDPQFVNRWEYNLTLNGGGAKNASYFLKSVTVTKLSE